MTTSAKPGYIGTEEAVWAMGCEGCTFGLIDPPPVNGHSVPLYIARAFQFHFGYLAVCDCQAGRAYAQYLTRTWNRIEDRSEHTPLTWSTALHTEMREMDRPPRMEGIQPAHEAAEAVRA